MPLPVSPGIFIYFNSLGTFRDFFSLQTQGRCLESLAGFPALSCCHVVLPVSGIWLLGPRLCGERAAPHPGASLQALPSSWGENGLAANWFCLSTLSQCLSCPRTGRDGAHPCPGSGPAFVEWPLPPQVSLLWQFQLALRVGEQPGASIPVCKTARGQGPVPARLPGSLSSSNAAFCSAHGAALAPDLPQRQKRGETKAWVGGFGFPSVWMGHGHF